MYTHNFKTLKVKCQGEKHKEKMVDTSGEDNITEFGDEMGISR